ncbi:MAG: hypothetical protein WC476_10445 [Phycisphaerae bacterium]|jgi:hypothetical protein
MKEGMKYHHIGIPTQTPRDGEIYDEKAKIWMVGCEKSPYSIEWLRYEKDCPFPELVKTVPHVGFAVDDMDEAIAGKNVIIEPFYVNETLRIAFIEDDGAPIEFLQFKK